MRVGRLSLLLKFASAFLAGFTISSGAATLVGANDPTQDGPNLQAAANAGGHWVLTGTFDLGPSGRVVLTTDVTFDGSTDGGGAKATIKRGDRAFLSPLPFSTIIPATMSPFALPAITAPGPRIVIRNLSFDGPTGAAVHIAYSSHLEVTGNTIRNVHRRLLTPTLPRHAGIEVGTQAYLVAQLRATAPANPFFHLLPPLRRHNTFVPGAVTGKILIASNDIEVDPATEPVLTARSSGLGIFLSMLDGADVRVSDNLVKGAARSGVEVLEPRRGMSGDGSVLIEGNRVVTPALGNFALGHGPNGIAVGWLIEPRAATSPTVNAAAVIRRNRIEMNGVADPIPGPIAWTTSIGIAVYADGVVVENNEVKTGEPSHVAISMFNARSLIRANKVAGPMGLGALRAIAQRIQVTVPDTWPDVFVVTAADENAFIGNNISHFTADRTYFPRASDIIVFPFPPVLPAYNVFVGGGGQKVLVNDQGLGTRITGYTPMTGGLGSALHNVLFDILPIVLD